MSGDTRLPFQKALYALLSEDGPLSSLITGVFDSVPETADYPYITIGDGTSVDFDTMTMVGMDSTPIIHTWSRAQGRTEALTIMQRVYDLLHNQGLAMTGASLVLMRCEFSEVMLDPDGTTYHGVQRFRVLTQGV